MCPRLLFIGLLSMVARGAETPGPARFYIVSRSFSDYGALFYHRVIDVRPDGDGALVRYVHVGPADVSCPRLIVQAARAAVPGKPPAELVRGNNPCAVKPRDIESALRKYKRKSGVLEAISFAVVAQCDSSPVTLTLPDVSQIDFDRMKAARPAIARLWDLASHITDPVFGTDDLFHDRTEEDELALQRAGEQWLPELTSGQYDTGLAAAVKGNIGEWPSPSFQALLAGYRGPISATERRAALVPQLLNSENFQFRRYAAPPYPPLARMARVQGKVELQLGVRRSTGEVHSVTARSGNPLLQTPSVEAARSWQFAPDSLTSDVVNVTLEYALRCR